MNSKRSTLKHIMLKLSKGKDKIKYFESVKREGIQHIQGALNKIISGFLIGNFRGQKEMSWGNQSALKKKENCQPRILYILYLYSHLKNRQNCSSKIRKKLRLFQISKILGSSLPLDFPCKKHYRESCSLKWKNNLKLCEGIKISIGFPWWLKGKESACQCRRHGFNPWSGKFPHAVEQLSPQVTITETVL